MRAGQTLTAQDGYEVALFPCEAMYITDGSSEHGVLALDFLPRNISGQAITAMPCYAPFSGTLVYTGNDHNCILESDNLVHMPDGSLKYGRVLVAHSFTAPVQGTHYNQGDEFYKSGDYGLSTGEHLHMEVASVDDTSTQYWNSGGIGLYDAIHMWNGLYVDNTVLLQDNGYNWQVWAQPIPEDGRKYERFKWVLYTNKLRERGRSDGTF